MRRRYRIPHQDHPRSRGVYGRVARVPGYFRGSSPLARGLRHFMKLSPETTRIIPARAGFTRAASWPRKGAADHPRSRGVYSHPAITFPVSGGSSPLARGLRGRAPGVLVLRRIIPARAGFTAGGVLDRLLAADHPRSRGVYLEIREECPARHGSSPLARGLLILSKWRIAAMRIIPARAGFTLAHYFYPALNPDHPRSRGVYVSHPYLPLTSQRIIPARAGFTPASVLECRPSKDHPRSRGVYPAIGRDRARCAGSSPLARGLLRSGP